MYVPDRKITTAVFEKEKHEHTYVFETTYVMMNLYKTSYSYFRGK
ncbi:hypothetical protein PB1_11539 [Bacillus methanolicus PB1]|uniref:Uncharacterized protein n=1 Tax=Bacillus methanolicus PB1 TaxID=997296 RepID=I3DVB9_BACMT|nr:hypothetical protein PB1_11539 [Bacillus methanolicus PB1]